MPSSPPRSVRGVSNQPLACPGVSEMSARGVSSHLRAHGRLQWKTSVINSKRSVVNWRHVCVSVVCERVLSSALVNI